MGAMVGFKEEASAIQGGGVTGNIDNLILCDTRKANGTRRGDEAGTNYLNEGNSPLQEDNTLESDPTLGKESINLDVLPLEGICSPSSYLPNCFVHYYVHIPDGKESTYNARKRNVPIHPISKHKYNKNTKTT